MQNPLQSIQAQTKRGGLPWKFLVIYPKLLMEFRDLDFWSFLRNKFPVIAGQWLQRIPDNYSPCLVLNALLERKTMFRPNIYLYSREDVRSGWSHHHRGKAWELCNWSSNRRRRGAGGVWLRSKLSMINPAAPRLTARQTVYSRKIGQSISTWCRDEY